MNEIYPISFELGKMTLAYGPANGSLGFITNRQLNRIDGIYWHPCRETFIYDLINEKRLENFQFVFYHDGLDGKQIAIFINEFEGKLGLKSRTKFYGFQGNQSATVVEPNLWWFENLMRLQLFTILMRCGMHYRGNFESALISINYARDTKIAIDKFLEGFTKWAGTETKRNVDRPLLSKEMSWKHGWVYFFKGGANLELMAK